MAVAVYASRFEGRTRVEQISELEWKMLIQIKYTTRNGEVFTVPVDFVTDFATIPRPFYFLYLPYGKYTMAAILHDYLRGRADISTARADEIFREASEDLGVDSFTAWVMWAALRLANHWHGMSEVLFWRRWLPIAGVMIPLVSPAGVINVLTLAAIWPIRYGVHLWQLRRGRQTTKPPFWFSKPADSCKERELR